MDLNAPVSKLPFVGPAFIKRLQKLNIASINDLLYHFPFRYEDFSKIIPINELKVGETVTISGIIWQIKNTYTKNRKIITKAIINDETGTVTAVWFNQSYLTKSLKEGIQVNLSGKVEFFSSKLSFISPEYEILNSSFTNPCLAGRRDKSIPIHTGRLVPIYPETAGLSSKWLRNKIKFILNHIDNEIMEWLPTEILREKNLLDLENSLKLIHFPENWEEAQKARERLIFEELFLTHLASLKRKRKWRQTLPSHIFSINQEKILSFLAKLPFQLTQAQARCLKEILADLKKEKPMNRLLQGDVGSGKTVVAAIASYLVFLNGYQTVIMTPTEILALQHYETFSQFLALYDIKIELYTGSKKFTTKNHKSPDIIIGTHALLSPKLNLSKVGLVIIDEQHRFGVKQRTALSEKGKSPHLLTMTATPIPRTIALTFYGDLDLSIIDEMPPKRQTVKTWVVPPEKRLSAYEWIQKQIKLKNSQAFIICPLIEESETLQTVRAATVEYQNLQKNIFSGLHLGLLHGRLKNREKDEVMQKFRRGKIDILVATPVVEVGIDIPSATIMMIEGSERFGLAQLHQLRGRVGRGQEQSYCLLFTEEKNDNSLKRLKTMETIYSGLKLAETDLQMRGPGEIYGTSQHGFFKFKIASLSDVELVEETKKEAEKFIDKLENYPALKEKLKQQFTDNVNPN